MRKLFIDCPRFLGHIYSRFCVDFKEITNHKKRYLIYSRLIQLSICKYTTKRIGVPQKVTLCRVDNLKRERGSQTQQIKTQPTKMIDGEETS